MAKKFRTEVDKDRFIVNTDGEIESFVTKKVYENQEDFMLTYLTSIDDLVNMESSLFKVMICCWKLSSFSDLNNEGNVVTNTPLFRQRCREMGLKMTDNAIRIAMSRLSKYGALIQLCKGTYLLNPKYFLKGTISKQTRMRFVTEYNPNGDDE